MTSAICCQPPRRIFQPDSRLSGPETCIHDNGVDISVVRCETTRFEIGRSQCGSKASQRIGNALLGRVAKCCCGAGGRSLRCVARCHYGRGLGCDPGRVPVGEDAGSPAGGSAHGGRGDRVAVPDGISVAGSARAVRELEHDLQELPALGDRRGLGRPVRPRAEASVASG